MTSVQLLNHSVGGNKCFTSSKRDSNSRGKWGGGVVWSLNPHPKERSEGPQPTEIKKQIGGVGAFLDFKTGHYHGTGGTQN